jgi:hypothetical protein
MTCPHVAEGDACQSCRAGAELLRPELLPVRFSNLKMIAVSPAHYLAAVKKDTAAMQRGRVLHALVLGGPRVVCYPGKTRQGKVWEAFKAANDGAEILTAKPYAAARGMADSVLRHKEAMQVLEGRHEVEIDWTYMGRKCQSHVDNIGPGGTFIAELKSAVSSKPERFEWQAHKMAYGGQVAFYLEGVKAAGLGEPTDAYAVVVEPVEPYVVTVMRAQEDVLDLGRRCVRLWMEQLLACEAANQWPGYVQGIVPWHAPSQDIDFIFGDEADGGAEPAHDPVTGEVAA